MHLIESYINVECSIDTAICGDFMGQYLAMYPQHISQCSSWRTLKLWSLLCLSGSPSSSLFICLSLSL